MRKVRSLAAILLGGFVGMQMLIWATSGCGLKAEADTMAQGAGVQERRDTAINANANVSAHADTTTDQSGDTGSVGGDQEKTGRDSETTRSDVSPTNTAAGRDVSTAGRDVVSNDAWTSRLLILSATVKDLLAFVAAAAAAVGLLVWHTRRYARVQAEGVKATAYDEGRRKRIAAEASKRNGSTAAGPTEN